MTARTPELSDPQGSREIRRRLTFDTARAADAAARTTDAVVRATPAGSSWQQADQAWSKADVPWPGAAAAAPAVPAKSAKLAKPAKKAKPKPVKQAQPAKASKAVKTVKAKPGPAKPAATAPKAAKPSAAPRAAASAKPATPARPVESAEAAPARRKRRVGRAAAVTVAAVVVVGGGVYAVTGGEEEGRAAAIPGAELADGFFAVDPAATTDGRVQDLAAVAAAGPTVVAAGAEGTEAAARAQFLVSADAGRTWRLASIRAADGGEPAPGDRPRHVAGGQGAWAALGDGGAAWSSGDARTWTRATIPVQPKDEVTGLARAASGFVAVGRTGDHAVLWTSVDGRSWQRLERPRVPGVVAFDRVVASGDTVLARGEISRTATKGKGAKKRRTTVREPALWRSADGGRTWARAYVPHGQGSYGAASGLVTGPGGFFAIRAGKRVTGPKKKRRTERFTVVFHSPDGSSWTALARTGVLDRLAGGSAAGLAALAGGRLMRSTDGRAWQPAGDVRGAAANGVTVADGGVPVVAGHRGDDPFLAVSGQAVDLRPVAGAVQPERSVAAIASGAAGRLVAVGGTNGGAAVWTTATPDGWARAQGTFGKGALSDVASGGAGWVAVGRGDRDRPLALTSADGTAWRPATIAGDGSLMAAAAGAGGYVVVGASRGSAAAWRSADLRTWTPAAGLDRRMWMRDVTATPAGYAAVGGSMDGKGTARAAVWTSADGLKWTVRRAPEGTGVLTDVAANGARLVALTTAGGAVVSADGGLTWQTTAPAGAAATGATAVVSTARGFVLAGVTGEPGGRDVTVWSSPDGAAWTRVPATGTGLDGPGDQRINVLTTHATEIVAVGVTAGHRGETPTLWRRMAP
ncbi:hypothetical protein [Spirillospora sp. NPDC047279]|uniref:hypothetical protein n=1 Tax=Spirillospora sp. NPDC047279 TaxID=3155478 RepID=UPI0033FAF000